MTFSDFLNAVRSAWGWFNNAGILLAVLAGAGVNAVCAEVPTWLAVVLCVVAYVAGFLAACYRASAETSHSNVATDAREAGPEAEVERLRGRLQTAEVPGAVAGLRTMAAAASAPTATAGGDPLAALLPAEAALLLRVYDSGTVRLDDSTLPVAKSLAEKGAIYRRDTHDSGVILDCDVMLSSDWVPVVRERADELRGARGGGCVTGDVGISLDGIARHICASRADGRHLGE